MTEQTKSMPPQTEQTRKAKLAPRPAKAQATSRPSSKLLLIVISGLLLALVLSIGTGYYTWWHLNQQGLQLANFTAMLDNHTKDGQQKNTQLAQAIQQVSAQLPQLKGKISQLEGDVDQAQQRMKQQVDLALTHLNADVNDRAEQWRLIDAFYLTNLANRAVNFGHDTESAWLLLKEADTLLKQMGSADLLAIRAALAQDMAKLNAVADPHHDEIILALSALNAQVDKLPQPVTTLVVKDDPQAQQRSTSSGQFTSLKQKMLQALDDSWQAIRASISIQKLSAPIRPLLTNEERAYLYHHIHLMLEQAQSAVFIRQSHLYQTALTRCRHWVSQYFDSHSELGQTFIQQLDQLLAKDINPPSVDISHSLKLLKSHNKQSASDAIQAPNATFDAKE